MCVNPKHVAVTTKVALADRNLRASTKTLNWKVKQLRAVQSKSKLTRDDVRTIRNTDGVSQTELARRYGVSRRAIQRILSDEGWKEPTSAMGMMAMQLR
jgi:DNA-binding transcriptional regulator YiaG